MSSPDPVRPPALVRLRTLGRDLFAGVDRRGVRRLFDEDATQAFRALADRYDEAERPKGFERLFLDARDFFLGVAFKLSPPRRMLFLASLAAPVLGIFDLDIQIAPYSLFVDASPFWFLISIAGMTLLLALELVDRLRVRDELEVARSLQRELLPQTSPAVPGYQVAHSYHTANEIGGDYYAFVPLTEDRLAVAVGDASGHGMSAGLLMAIANAAFEAALDLDADPSAVLEMVNRTLFRTGGRRAFMSLFYGVLEPSTGRLDWANAGHPFPLVRRRSGQVEEVGHGSFPLGLRASGSVAGAWPRGQIQLEPGDRLVLYSDGIPEAMGEDEAGRSRDFGFDRLQALVREPASASSLHDRVLAALRGHLGEKDLRDDVTLVVIDRLPPVPPAPPIPSSPLSLSSRTAPPPVSSSPVSSPTVPSPAGPSPAPPPSGPPSAP